MPKIMKSITIFSFIATIIMSILFLGFDKSIYLTLAITFGTTFYHFIIRLLIGFFHNTIMSNRADYTKKWYRVSPWEIKLYELLRVKKWKSKMPTYNPENFSITNHSLDEIAQVMCQSELVHETNIIFSFMPVFASKLFGSFYVFLITSLCAAAFDLLFVIMQRYNRSRVIKATL